MKIYASSIIAATFASAAPDSRTAASGFLQNQSRMDERSGMDERPAQPVLDKTDLDILEFAKKEGLRGRTYFNNNVFVNMANYEEIEAAIVDGSCAKIAYPIEPEEYVTKIQETVKAQAELIDQDTLLLKGQYLKNGIYLGAHVSVRRTGSVYQGGHVDYMEVLLRSATQDMGVIAQDGAPVPGALSKALGLLAEVSDDCWVNYQMRFAATVWKKTGKITGFNVRRDELARNYLKMIDFHKELLARNPGLQIAVEVTEYVERGSREAEGSDDAIQAIMTAGIPVGYDDMLSSFENVQSWPASWKTQGGNSVSTGAADGYHNFVDLLNLNDGQKYTYIKIASKMVLDAFSMASLRNWTVNGPNTFTFTKGHLLQEYKNASLDQKLAFMTSGGGIVVATHPERAVAVSEGLQFFALLAETEKEIAQKRSVYRSEIAGAIKLFPNAKFVFEASVTEEDLDAFTAEFGLEARRKDIMVSGGLISDLSLTLKHLDMLMTQ